MAAVFSTPAHPRCASLACDTVEPNAAHAFTARPPSCVRGYFNRAKADGREAARFIDRASAQTAAYRSGPRAPGR
ncbi:hypothetical protein BSIN_3218 [Burkholderia singularis]|uniref:Uncharacterized protein n=1 Tax=Burkholderia singularis TaxID=1503053 RepID=A0A238H3Y6_9BURK|nr:hypothetical protein BSIN_3218 [Burkholderia singularis]